MFIYHFNRLIRNRWLWGFFAIFIVFAFVVADLISPRGDKENAAEVGILGGKKISGETFDFLARAVRGFGTRGSDGLSDSAVNRETWQRLAAIQTAQKMGIAATDAIVRQELGAPFTRNGHFDAEAYNRFLQSQGLKSQLLERQVREEFPYNVMRNVLLQSAVWASPMEVDAEIQVYLDRITAAAMTFTNPDAEKALDLPEEELRAFYEDNVKSFEVPDRVAVRYFAVPITNFYAKVDLSEDEIVRYYEDFEERYTTIQGEGTNATPVQLTLEEARDRVREDLIKESAPDQARKYFTTAGVDIALKSGFAALAAELGQTVETTPLFPIDAPPAGITDGRAFAEAAFETDPAQPMTRFASAMGADRIYFLELASTEDRHTPAFDAIRADVKSRAEAATREKNFTAYAEKVAAELGDVMKMPEMTWQKATQAAAVHGMNVSTSLTFVVSDLQTMPDYPYANATISTAIHQPAGTVSEPVAVGEGTMLLVFVENREPGDARRAEMMRSQIRSQIVQSQAPQIVDGWMAWNLDRVGLKNVKDNVKPTLTIGAPTIDPDEDE